MVTVPPSSQQGKRLDFFDSPPTPPVTSAHLRSPIRFHLGPAFGFGIDHFVDLIPDESLAAHPFPPLVVNLKRFKSVILFSSRGTVLYLLLY